MAGIRIGGVSVIVTCSPPFGALHGTDYAGADGNVYRACLGDPAGAASQYSSFDDGATTSEGVHNPVLSPDESQILFEVANPSTGFTEIWVVDNIPGSTATQLLADASNYYLHPSWHPDSNQFVCVHGASGGLLGSIIKTSVGSPGTTSTLKNKSGTNSPFRPQFNFDGSRVVYFFDQNVGGTGELRCMDDDGTNDTLLDNAVKYLFQGPQGGWAHSSSVFAYDDGSNAANNASVINEDGTGQQLINGNGDAAGSQSSVSHLCWPPDDSYVVVGSISIFGAGNPFVPTRCELDGSTSNYLETSNGANSNNPYMTKVLVADGRCWFIEDNFIGASNKVSSVAIDGSDYVNYLDIDGAQMDDISTGDGWYYN